MSLIVAFREVRFAVTEQEYSDILAYVQKKRRWRNIPSFLRDACFQTMERYPAYEGKKAHGSNGGAPRDSSSTPVK